MPNAGTYKFTLARKSPVGPGIYRLTFDARTFPAEVGPFQFVMVAVPGRPDLLLRRPFSVFNVKAGGKNVSSVEILLRVAGVGTEALAEAPEGTRTRVTGPFGTDTDIPGNITVVAGGIGVAGVMRFASANRERVRAFYFGSRTAWDTGFYEELEDAAGAVSVATDDGSRGHRGPVTDIVEPDGTVLACGPPQMLAKVHELADAAGVRAYGSFEARMACGVGACRGCVVPVRPERAGGKEYQTVCREGPVFPMDLIDWERYKGTSL